MAHECRVGVDVGGTFTDAVLYNSDTNQLVTAKVPTSLPDPSLGIMESVHQVCASAGIHVEDIDSFLHGTTIATNALLENRGAPTGMLTTAGFRDIAHIGRHQRPQNYSIMQDIPWQDRALVLRRNRRVVAERISGHGEVLSPMDEEGLIRAAEQLVEGGVRSIVIAFLNSYRNPTHELRAQEIIKDRFPDLFVTASSQVVAQFREFERFTTAAINGFVGPLVKDYVRNVCERLKAAGVRSPVQLMMSNGGTTTPQDAAHVPAALLMSGPAAGILGGRWACESAEMLPGITFDMGGTSADIGIVTTSGISEASSRDTWVAGFPVLIPMLDVLTVGSGGGSVAFLDAGGALRVGPRSSGAVPGPACYSNGGTEPTVTDAHAALGRLDPDRALGGSLYIDVDAAREAVGKVARGLAISLEETAEGIIRIANNNMAAAIRTKTVQRGIDPRNMSLIAFGGAGPLHAAELADMLGVSRVVIPAAPGNTSAFGLLTTSLRYSSVATIFAEPESCDVDALSTYLDSEQHRLLGELSESGQGSGHPVISSSVDCRYIGQGYELNIPLPAGKLTKASLVEVVRNFHETHQREYGHNFPGDPVELVNIRTSVAGARPALSLGDGRRAVRPTVRSHYGTAWFRIEETLEAIPVEYRDRAALGRVSVHGPIVICQDDTTLVVPPGWDCMAHSSGILVVSKGGLG